MGIVLYTGITCLYTYIVVIQRQRGLKSMLHSVDPVGKKKKHRKLDTEPIVS